MNSSPLAVVALVGRMVVLFSLLMLVPLAFGLVHRHDAAEHAFLVSTGVITPRGALMSLATRRFRRELQPRDGFVLVGLTWLVLPAFGALPLLLAIPGLSVTDAYFEAMRGFTATGATVLSGLDALPLSVNVWRCFMHADRRAGHHRAGGGHPAAAGRGRRAAVQGRDGRPDEGRQAHAAYRRDGARPVGGVLRRVGALPASPTAGRA
jgi:hypothetical protein